jgi:hypothetical protein
MFERFDNLIVLNPQQFFGAARRKATLATDGSATFSTIIDIAELSDPSCMD